MEAVIDTMGRIVVPKPWRVALGLTPGTKVDISPYGAGLTITPGGRTARIVRDEHGNSVGESDTVVTDEVLYALIDAGRR
ncbi:MAG: AbrB/MazE/SpoVT family DNA-binding domain-containing protein [Bifidobacteriaceae bacterium]|jgi:AbrB family looped-hinge helix DNA binding protein|nr:AbrB/MazE/SpoVT family DNA-binding domain-containing protein [Bifidobacteriaceae bacterium]